MFQISIERLQQSGMHCSHWECTEDPSCHVNILGSVWHIKVDTVVAIVTMGNRTEYYCRVCIDKLYKTIKIKLDPKLWAFH